MVRLALLLVTLLVLAVPARALTVLELFTSQGCNSCPPADALLDELADRPGILALSFHVDYWDRFGWKDIFSAPWATARQRAYGEAFRTRYIYTPMLVAGGRAHVVGSDRAAVAGLVERAAAHPQLHLRYEAASRNLVLPAAPGAAGRILAVEFSPHETVRIGRGENGGRTITYRNVVRRIETLSEWSGAAGTLMIPALAGHVAILVQERGGAIRAALVLGDG